MPQMSIARASALPLGRTPARATLRAGVALLSAAAAVAGYALAVIFLVSP